MIDTNPFGMWVDDCYKVGQGGAALAMDGVHFTPDKKETYNIRLRDRNPWAIQIYQTKGGDFSMLSPAGAGGIGFESALPEEVQTRIKEKMVALVKAGLCSCKDLYIVLDDEACK